MNWILLETAPGAAQAAAMDDIDIKVRIILFALGLLGFLLVIRLVKRRRIWERYALIWVYAGLVMACMPLLTGVLNWFAIRVLQVDYPPAFYNLMGIFAVLLLLLQFSIEITTLVRRSRNTVQELAILEERVRTLERAGAGGGPRPEGGGQVADRPAEG